MGENMGIRVHMLAKVYDHWENLIVEWRTHSGHCFNNHVCFDCSALQI